MIRARLLGPLEVTVDGNPAPTELLWRKHVALLLVLWLSGDRGRTRDQLIGLFWSDKAERAARHSLSEALRVIRRTAGDAAIDAGVDRVRWVGTVDLDVIRFAELERDAPEEAAALVFGEFCEGFAVPDATEFEQWIADARGQWRSRLVGVLVRAARAVEDRGDAASASALADRALRLDAHSDRAAQEAMRARWLLGDRTGAIRLGEAFRARLAEDLAVAPDRETTVLLERIARERRPRRARETDGTTVARHPPLVGREAEVVQWLSCFREARASRHANLVVLSAEPGMGRSRLLEECLLRAVMEGAAVARLRAVDHDASRPGALWLGLASGGILDFPGLASAPPEAMAVIAGQLVSWAERFPSAGTVGSMTLEAAVHSILAAVADEAPIVLAVDDAHRLHPDDLRAIPALIRTLDRQPVMALVTLDRLATSDAADEVRRNAGRDEHGMVIGLVPLSLTALEVIVTWALPGWEAPARERLARRLLADSAGAPAVAVEVLAAVREGLALTGTSEPWPEPARTLDATLPGPLPESLVAAVRLAFRQLPDAVQQLLPVLALLPPPVTAEQLVPLLDLPDLEATLDQAEGERWIAADGRGYSFVARVVGRLLAEEMLTPGQRRRLEARIAGSLQG